MDVERHNLPPSRKKARKRVMRLGVSVETQKKRALRILKTPDIIMAGDARGCKGA